MLHKVVLTFESVDEMLNKSVTIQMKATEPEADPGFFVGGGALLRNGVIYW